MFPQHSISLYGKYTKILGSGTYSNVYLYTKDNKNYACKCYKYIDGAINDISYTILLKDHPNIINIIDIIRTSDKLITVMDAALTDLSKIHNYIKDGKYLRPLIYQMCSAVVYCHQNDVWHCDIKPQNWVYDQSTESIKLIDFGLAKHRVLDEGKHTYPTRYIYSLGLNAPENLLNKHIPFNLPSDIWALGCCVFHLITTKTPFGSSNEISVLFNIFKLLGTPDRKTWPSFDKQELWNNDFPKYKRNLEICKKELYNHFKPEYITTELIDLLLALFEYSPLKRINHNNLLLHPYFKNMDIPTNKRKITIVDSLSKNTSNILGLKDVPHNMNNFLNNLYLRATKNSKSKIKINDFYDFIKIYIDYDIDQSLDQSDSINLIDQKILNHIGDTLKWSLFSS